MKKAIARGSKAKQKAKKRQVEEKVCQLSTKLKGNHFKELATLGYSVIQRSARPNRGETKDLNKKQKGSRESKQSRVIL
ncbi:hypothetical protein glysoja_043187 [Glycine soja]|uniref:Uncharacterized protein n=1 Tax=Glycine soja TaxID=3848 RepID=A0A0B2SEY8_GLYSO|nr:hypothetical protein glysoja_043187 [Glycine soja]